MPEGYMIMDAYLATVVYVVMELYATMEVYMTTAVCLTTAVYLTGCVAGAACVNGDKVISGTGLVKSDDDYATISGFGTENRTTTFFRCKDGRVRVLCGCFYGTINQFRKQVKKTRNGQVAKDYLAIADLMEDHFKNL